MPEGQRRQLLPLVEREPACPHRGQHTVVSERVDDYRDAGVVLRGGAHHRRAADVDLLDALVDAGAGVDGLGERVQVDDHEFECFDAEFGQRRNMLWFTKIGEQTGMHMRVQGLYPAVEHLGEAGDLFDRGDRNSRARNRFGR